VEELSRRVNRHFFVLLDRVEVVRVGRIVVETAGLGSAERLARRRVLERLH